MVDVALPGIGADHEPRHAEPVPLAVDDRRLDVVEEAAPVVPGQEDRRAVPVGASHHGVHELGHPRLPFGDWGAGMVAVGPVGRDPRHVRQRAARRRGVEP